MAVVTLQLDIDKQTDRNRYRQINKDIQADVQKDTPTA